MANAAAQRQETEEQGNTEVANPNMALWDKVFNTDPKYTKKVGTRGGFTAIDAYYQIREATAIFGPVGDGWGWEIVDTIYPPNDTVQIRLRVWQNTPQGIKNGPEQFGSANLRDKGGRADTDAFKKATTDAITKCLSYWGFSADVFMGMFDDNKYVELQQEQSQTIERSNKEKESKTRLGAYQIDIGQATTIVELDNISSGYTKWIGQMKDEQRHIYEAAATSYKRKRAEIEQRLAAQQEVQSQDTFPGDM